ncbi:MAG: thiamine phosphate synthase, partial [Spirochaetia bacterium]|nr:thiamine phosphate synthase [Spirochaetia bacterium]
MKKISRLHFLTQDHSERSHASQAEAALRAGADWIQFRSKEKSPAEITKTALEIKTLCLEYGAVLIINDHVELAHEIGCGVHLGKSDRPVSEARKILGEECFIGGTANTFEDIEALVAAGADYVGV